MDIPKKIWIFWEQGFDNASSVCKMCLKSWIFKNESWEVIALNKNKLTEFVDVYEINKNFYKINRITSRADLIRTLLLKQYGGVWVDATLYCYKPLDCWLKETINDQDFFTFTYPDNKISNWFIASTPNNHIINKFSEIFFNHFKNTIVAKNYFLFHDIFHKLLKTDDQFKINYQNIKKLDSKKAIILNFHKNQMQNKNFDKKYLEDLKVPVFKFSSKQKFANLDKMIDYLNELNFKLLM